MTLTTTSQPATPRPASPHRANPLATATTSVAHAPAAAARVGLVVGATGLVGQAVLARLLDDKAYSSVHTLGRRAPNVQHPKLVVHLASSLLAFDCPAVDDVYLALGTTRKTAGSQAAVKAIDLEAVVAVASAAFQAGATRMAVVSAMGADANSIVFYSQIKGLMEQAVRQIGFATLVIARPSLLAGNRDGLQQTARWGEKLALSAARWLNPLLPVNYRSVDAAQVARAMVDTLQSAGPGQHVLLSGEIRRFPVSTTQMDTQIHA